MSKQRGSFTHLRNDSAYKVMGGPNLATEIWQKACPTNWRGRLNRDFRWVLRMRAAMPNSALVITLLASVAVSCGACDRVQPNIAANEKFSPKKMLGWAFKEASTRILNG